MDSPARHPKTGRRIVTVKKYADAQTSKLYRLLRHGVGGATWRFQGARTVSQRTLPTDLQRVWRPKSGNQPGVLSARLLAQRTFRGVSRPAGMSTPRRARPNDATRDRQGSVGSPTLERARRTAMGFAVDDNVSSAGRPNPGSVCTGDRSRYRTPSPNSQRQTRCVLMLHGYGHGTWWGQRVEWKRGNTRHPDR